MAWPEVAAAIASLVQAGSSAYGASQTGGQSGLSSDDQRWLADFNWKQSLRNEEFSHKQYEEQFAWQQQLAQHGLSMTIEDAAKYGISPLAAIGGGRAQASPISVMGGGGPVSGPSVSRDSRADAIMHAGQNVSRAITATQDRYTRASEQLDLARKTKENDLLDVQLANAKFQLAKQVGTQGIPAAYQAIRNRDGSTSYIPSEEAARGAHAESFGPLMWSIHNGMIPETQGAVRAAPQIRWSTRGDEGSRMREINRNNRNRP